MFCPTVKVKCPASEDNPAGEMIINQSDYDAAPDQYELVSDAPVVDAGAPPDATPEPKAKRVKRVG